MIAIILSILLLHPGPGNPVELGDVYWLRNLEEAKTQSRSSCKPILILFQEVPGCQTCRQYGSEVLSHPLIVEAIETYFIPLAIYNNKDGHDGEVLKLYNEPSWNNPVVRIVNEKGENVMPRLYGNYSASGLVDMIVNELIKRNGKAPEYLQLLADELTARKRGTSFTTYSMYCFWTGEALFGKINGVISTEAGWQNGKEIVRVEYDASIVSKSQLDKIAERSGCRAEANTDYRRDATPKYYLSNHAYKSIPMTDIQKCRVNSALAEHQQAKAYLSPRQLAFLDNKSKQNNVSRNIHDAWNVMLQD